MKIKNNYTYKDNRRYSDLNNDLIGGYNNENNEDKRR